MSVDECIPQPTIYMPTELNMKINRRKHIYIYIPRVEAGKDTTTVIPESRKRRRKGNRINLR
jgi:hypothetical protein